MLFVQVKRGKNFDPQEIETLKCKIVEIEWQKQGASYGFNRSWTLDDSRARKQRELFRLTHRLPALAKREEFEAIVKDNQFVVVKGETGSGKSTQLAQYLADMPEFTGKLVSADLVLGIDHAV